MFALDTGSVLCRIATWDCLGAEIMTPFPGQLHNHQFATLEARRRLGRDNVRKDFWDGYWGQGKKLANS